METETVAAEVPEGSTAEAAVEEAGRRGRGHRAEAEAAPRRGGPGR